MSEPRKRAIICQPPANLESIYWAIRKEAVSKVEEKGYEYVDTTIVGDEEIGILPETPNVKHVEAAYMGARIRDLCFCDAVYFCKGWNVDRDCLIMWVVARMWGIEVLYDEDAEPLGVKVLPDGGDGILWPVVPRRTKLKL